MKLRGANAEDLWPRILTFDALAEEHLTLALKYKCTGGGGKGDDDNDDNDDGEEEGLSVGFGVVKAERPPPERLRGKPVPSETRLARLAAQRIALERECTPTTESSSSHDATDFGSSNQQVASTNRRRRASSRMNTSSTSKSAPGQIVSSQAIVELKATPGAAVEAAEDDVLVEKDDQGFDWKDVAKGELSVLQLTKVAIPAVLLEIRDNGPRLKTWQKKIPK